MTVQSPQKRHRFAAYSCVLRLTCSFHWGSQLLWFCLVCPLCPCLQPLLSSWPLAFLPNSGHLTPMSTCSHSQIIPTCRHACLLLSQWSFVVHQLTGPFPFSFCSCQRFWPGACYLSFALLPTLPCLSFASLDCLLVPNYNAVNLNVGLGNPVSFGRCFCFSARIWLRKPIDLYTHTWQRYVDQNSDGAVWVYGECKTVWS